MATTTKNEGAGKNEPLQRAEDRCSRTAAAS